MQTMLGDRGSHLALVSQLRAFPFRSFRPRILITYFGHAGQGRGRETGKHRDQPFARERLGTGVSLLRISFITVWKISWPCHFLKCDFFRAELFFTDFCIRGQGRGGEAGWLWDQPFARERLGIGFLMVRFPSKATLRTFRPCDFSGAEFSFASFHLVLFGDAW